MDSVLEAERPHLLRLAYHLLGSVADAEDMVQESYLRWRRAGSPELDRPRAWFTRTVTRLCLDRLRAVQRERSEYVGEWLPELWVDDTAAPDAELDESISMALLATLETLRPAERAAFLLHDVFGYPFADVAEVLTLEVPHCRQLAVRARRHLQTARVRERAEPEALRRLSDGFLGAVTRGDLKSMEALLAEDAVLHSDGGGKVPAARRAIEGAAQVARFLHRVLRVPRGAPPYAWRRLRFNGAPGLVLLVEGVPVSAFQFQLQGERIARIFVQRNPDKLRGVGDATGL